MECSVCQREMQSTCKRVEFFDLDLSLPEA